MSRRRSQRLVAAAVIAGPVGKAPAVATTTTVLLAKSTSSENGNHQAVKKKVAAATIQEETVVVSPSPSSKTKAIKQSTTKKVTVKKTRVTKAKTTKPKDKEAPTTPKSKTTSTKKKSPRKSPTRPEPGSKSPPEGWLDIYELVKELRQDRSAPVDEAGAEVLPERGPNGEIVKNKTFRFQVLIALMLSSQTKDAVVGAAMRDLQQHGLTCENIAHNTSHEQLNHLIQKVGFHNNKTKYIKQVVHILLDQYEGDIPKTAHEMIDNLPGVGPKMAFLIETIAWGTTSGIGIDTHMHRMFNQLKWVPSTNNPEQTRVELEAWLPREYWPEINYIWVGFGQEVQQFKPKMLAKALNCSRPIDALKLLKKLGFDAKKEGDKAGMGEEVRKVLQQ